MLHSDHRMAPGAAQLQVPNHMKEEKTVFGAAGASGCLGNSS